MVILIVLSISASNVLLIDQLNPNYVHFVQVVIFFSASSCIEFYLVFDKQFLGFSTIM